MIDGKKDQKSSSKLNSAKEIIPMKTVINEVPGVKMLALSYAFAKGSRYWYFYWAPAWLVAEGDFSVAQASFLSVALDIGSCLALIVLGPITTKNRFMSKPIPPLYLAMASQNILAVSAVLALLGFVVALSDPIYSGMCTNEAADIDGRNLHASCAGFVNGVGSLGAAILNPLASYMAGLDKEKGYIYALMTVAVALLTCTVTTFVAHKQLRDAKERDENRVQS